MPPPKIAVIGAGPAGLTFARLLQNNGVRCTIYEADEDRHTRNQGGTLDLHAQAGQQALKEAGLFEQFQNASRPEGEALRLLKYTGEVIADENQAGTTRPKEYADRPEIDRVRLKDILLDSIQPNTIKWNHKVSSIEADSGSKGKYAINFADGTQETDIDLLVGADGAWSKVRSLVSDIKPYYSGITAAELWALDVTTAHPWLVRHVGAGSNFMFDEGRAVMCQRNGNDSIRVYACLQKPENWKDDSGIDWTNHGEVRETLVNNYFNDCGDDIKRSILESRDECICRQLYMLPVGHEWKNRSGVTLLGDSAHLMTPFAGVGVNLAMFDALQLARELIKRKDSFVAKAFSDSHNIDAAIKAYEKEMFPRAKKYAQKTCDGMVEHFSRDGGQRMVDRAKAARTAE